MREKYRQLQHIIDEKKALDALRKRVEEEGDSLETRRLKYQQLQMEKDELTQQIVDRDLNILLDPTTLLLVTGVKR